MALGAKVKNLSPVTDAELKRAIAALAPPLCPVCHGPLDTEVEGRPSWRLCSVRTGVEKSEDSSGKGKITVQISILCKGFDGRSVDEARAAASRYQEIR